VTMNRGPRATFCPISRWVTCRSQTCSSAQEVNSASAISCCGSLPIPSSISRTPCGLTSTRRRLMRRSPLTAGASDASAVPANSCPPCLWRAALRADRARRQTASAMLRARVATVAVLLPLFIGGMFFLDQLGWAVLLLPLLLAGGREWAGLAGFGRNGSLVFCGALALSAIVLLLGQELRWNHAVLERVIFGFAVAFWFL